MNVYFYDDNSISKKHLHACKGRVHFGLCCINNGLKDQGITCNRTCIRSRFTVEHALNLATKNVSDIIPLLQYNIENKIGSYRLSSDMFPHFTDTETTPYEPTQEIKDILAAAGQYAQENNIRLTMHPGQYNVVGTPNSKAFEQTVKDLTHHAWILDTMNANDNGILCIHMGGAYGDMESTIRRWIDQFDDLPSCVKRRLCIENTERNGSVRECLTIAQECKIPMIYDSHHEICYRYLHPEENIEQIEDQMDEIIASWNGKTPLFHVSDQHEDITKVCKHHDFVEHLPATQLRCCLEYDTDITIEVEAKAKEAAIHKLQSKYSSFF